MISTDAPLFGRVLTAMVTPFTDDLEVDYRAVERLVDFLIETGTDTLVVSGTTGESPTLEDSEKKELLKAVKAAAGGRAKIIFGAGTNCTAKTARACQEAESLGADGLLVVAPYYNKPSQEGLIAHFSAAAAATTLPIVVYNIPGRTGVNVSAGTIIELSRRYPNIHALKESTGSTDQAAEIACKARPDFKIYSGDDYLTLPFLSVGAAGVVSVASHLAGARIKEMIEAFFSGNPDKARSLHATCLPLFKGLFAAPNPTCVKFALSCLGLCKPHLRLPLVALNETQQEDVRSLLKQCKIGMETPVS